MPVFLDLLFPRRCLGCDQWGAYFCSQCLNYLSLNNEPICPVCEKNSIGGFTHPGCLKPQSLNGLTTIFVYKGLIKKAIKKLKYKFVSDLAEDLAELFLSFCGEDKAFVRFCRKRPSLVPIPLHPRRKRWRGFNQAELLGEMIASNLEIDFLPDLLLRVRNTKPQTKLKKEERQKNIQGAFKMNSKYLPARPRPTSLRRSRCGRVNALAFGGDKFARLASKDFKMGSESADQNSHPFVWRLKDNMRNVLVFDDVWTSGATLKEAAKVLKRNEVEKVWGLTLAR